MATKTTKTAKTLTFVNLTYPKALMFGETYDVNLINAELEEGLTVDKIETTWLDVQPPFETMGFYPLQITVHASNGAVATQDVEVFVYEKPHDGYQKFIIFKNGSNKMRLTSYDCSDNEEDAKLYYNGSSSILNIGKNNGYLGRRTYTFNTETNKWDYDNHVTYSTGSSNTINGLSVVKSIDNVYYSNSDIYLKDEKTLGYKADVRKTTLPKWNTEMEGRYIVEYPDVKAFDETIEAYYVQYGTRDSAKGVYAIAFRNLSEGVATLNFTPKYYGNPFFKLDGSDAEYIVLRLDNSGVWKDTGVVGWKKKSNR